MENFNDLEFMLNQIANLNTTNIETKKENKKETFAYLNINNLNIKQENFEDYNQNISSNFLNFTINPINNIQYDQRLNVVRTEFTENLLSKIEQYISEFDIFGKNIQLLYGGSNLEKLYNNDIENFKVNVKELLLNYFSSISGTDSLIISAPTNGHLPNVQKPTENDLINELNYFQKNWELPETSVKIPFPDNINSFNSSTKKELTKTKKHLIEKIEQLEKLYSERSNLSVSLNSEIMNLTNSFISKFTSETAKLFGPIDGPTKLKDLTQENIGLFTKYIGNKSTGIQNFVNEQIIKLKEIKSHLISKTGDLIKSLDKSFQVLSKYSGTIDFRMDQRKFRKSILESINSVEYQLNRVVQNELLAAQRKYKTMGRLDRNYMLIKTYKILNNNFSDLEIYFDNLDEIKNIFELNKEYSEQEFLNLIQNFSELQQSVLRNKFIEKTELKRKNSLIDFIRYIKIIPNHQINNVLYETINDLVITLPEEELTALNTEISDGESALNKFNFYNKKINLLFSYISNINSILEEKREWQKVISSKYKKMQKEYLKYSVVIKKEQKVLTEKELEEYQTSIISFNKKLELIRNTIQDIIEQKFSSVMLKNLQDILKNDELQKGFTLLNESYSKKRLKNFIQNEKIINELNTIFSEIQSEKTEFESNYLIVEPWDSNKKILESDVKQLRLDFKEAENEYTTNKKIISSLKEQKIIFLEKIETLLENVSGLKDLLNKQKEQKIEVPTSFFVPNIRRIKILQEIEDIKSILHKKQPEQQEILKQKINSLEEELKIVNINSEIKISREISDISESLLNTVKHPKINTVEIIKNKDEKLSEDEIEKFSRKELEKETTKISKISNKDITNNIKLAKDKIKKINERLVEISKLDFMDKFLVMNEEIQLKNELVSLEKIIEENKEIKKSTASNSSKSTIKIKIEKLKLKLQSLRGDIFMEVMNSVEIKQIETEINKLQDELENTKNNIQAKRGKRSKLNVISRKAFIPKTINLDSNIQPEYMFIIKHREMYNRENIMYSFLSFISPRYLSVDNSQMMGLITYNSDLSQKISGIITHQEQDILSYICSIHPISFKEIEKNIIGGGVIPQLITNINNNNEYVELKKQYNSLITKNNEKRLEIVAKINEIKLQSSIEEHISEINNLNKELTGLLESEQVLLDKIFEIRDNLLK